MVFLADDPREVLLRAIALAAQGRYARAAADLRRLAADRDTDAVLRSAARCALASHRRQAGGHRRALVDDGAAAALAHAAPDGSGRRAVLADALTGLAADRLGTGDLAGSGRLLTRAEEVLDAGRPTRRWECGGRPALRTAWVRAEWHLYSGRAAEAMVAADRAASQAADCPSARHRLKTDLLVAACRAGVGERDAARETATDVASRAGVLRQRPLEWAAWGLLADLATDDDDRRGARSQHVQLGHRLRRQLPGFGAPAT
ncbi:MAG: hypothetical protein INR72_04545 [Williamsia herbipolensis]|nr:hypothetical protein [Williamsia herbipolensis]